AAVSKYLLAIHLDPEDLAPRRALSSARFGLGDYSTSLAVTDEALALEDDEKRQEILRLRQGKCYFYLNLYDEAGEILESRGQSKEVQKLLTVQKFYREHQ
ncbi:hypothetical protein BDD12DRAFT_907368, partial [Trichophaea hybrida]